MNDEYFHPRWRGQPGRLETWYTTITDPATGTGVWLHHELVAPTDGGPAHGHGWAALFPPDGAPTLARFGPVPWEFPDDCYAAGDVRITPTRLTGQAGEARWDLTQDGGGAPLFTFPRWAWRRGLLPAAHLVPAPGARFSGTVTVDGTALTLRDAPGATGRIYGHGHARRWAWLHADLGDGDVCEVVAAVSNRPGMRRLRPLPFVRLRIGGADWPAGDPLLNAVRMRARIGLPEWTVTGRSGGRRLHIEVSQPPERTVAVAYADPDGTPTVCRNTERATATITLSRRRRGAWTSERRWHLDGTAHAEVGGHA